MYIKYYKYRKLWFSVEKAHKKWWSNYFAFPILYISFLTIKVYGDLGYGQSAVGEGRGIIAKVNHHDVYDATRGVDLDIKASAKSLLSRLRFHLVHRFHHLLCLVHRQDGRDGEAELMGMDGLGDREVPCVPILVALLLVGRDGIMD